jgi:CRISP-associated protein Cas1
MPIVVDFLSLENFQAAWLRVARNKGCAGVDGETIAAFANRADETLVLLIRQIRAGTYVPLPLRQLWVPKKDGTWRGLAVPTVRDRVVQQALLNILHQVMEPQFEEASFAYRPGRMATLYLVHQGTMLRKEQGRFVVQPPRDTKAGEAIEIPIREVERILVLGNVQVSTQAIAVCLEEQIPVVFLTQLGDYKGHLWSSEFCDLGLEAAQYGRRQDGQFQVEMARRIVIGKILNSKLLLLRLGRKREVEGLMARVKRLGLYVGAIEGATDVNVIRGYEGAAAKLYFGVLGQLITHPDLKLEGRSRRPPKDPVNSLLSFGYTLLFNNVMSLILAEGLNPYLGNLHRSSRREPHLAFDLMEEFRSPVVDSLVMGLVNKRIVKPTDFTWPNEAGGVYLDDPGRRVFLKYFEDRISEPVSYPGLDGRVSYRRVIQLQVQRYKRCLVESVPYEAYLRPV